mmetsp:Transcript_45810/g.46469  ORF Transcript_45810/g.46469 Transcript_45810/m.46469 type:complete len:85 (-) Transcript_45810:797-1051(-)
MRDGQEMTYKKSSHEETSRFEFDWIRFAFSTIPSSSSLSQSILLLLLFIDIMIHVTIDPPLIEIEDLRVILTKKIENKFGMSIH